MGDIMNEKMREQFEAWAMTSAYLGLSDTCMERFKDGYLGGELHAAWIAWQASRAALVIQLPEKCEYADSQSGYAKGHRQGKRDLVDCIEAAGLKVAP